jgi:hypothetical protein
MTEPWQCPSCETWMAPGITEHRCEGDGGVPAITSTPPDGPWPWAATVTTTPTESVITYMWPSTTTVNVHGSVMTERALMAAVQRASRWGR